MGVDTKIQWCDHTFNCWIGCIKCSEGCLHCYAPDTTPVKVSKSRGLELWGPEETANRRVASEAMWREPLKWDRQAREEGVRRRVFCASLADVFENWNGPMVNAKGERLYRWKDGSWGPVGLDPGPAPPLTMDDCRDRLARLIEATRHLDWLLVTKRIDRAARFWRSRRGAIPRNLWQGCTVESQKRAVERIPHLLGIDAAVRFLSVEPMLGPIDLTRAWWITNSEGEQSPSFWARVGIDWVIVGGESGPDARPFQVEWARQLRDQCRAAGVPFFLKQLGSNPFDAPPDCFDSTDDVWTLNLADPKGGDPAEWPEDLRVREFPNP